MNGIRLVMRDYVLRGPGKWTQYTARWLSVVRWTMLMLNIRSVDSTLKVYQVHGPALHLWRSA